MVDLRKEYPRPQFVREDWLCLNGEWEFAFDENKVGLEKNYPERTHFDGRITVPYAPESPLSGIGDTDFHNALWYRRDVALPSDWKGGRVLLHFGAVDHTATVFLNGKRLCRHEGGYTPFTVELTEHLNEGVNSLCVYAEDDLRSEKQAGGKQSIRLDSYCCSYTRTTGIWQTVWLEHVPSGYIKSHFVYPNISAPSVTVRVRTSGAVGQTLTVSATYEGRPMGEASVAVLSEETVLSLPLAEAHLWEVGHGRLYDLVFRLSGGDAAGGYFGLREVSCAKDGFRLNGKVVFGRWVLDQGFYPDGIYTAPSDAALEQDVLDGMAFGFNGARMHEKVFEPRYLYHADRHGYLVWGEYPNWGLDIHTYDAIGAFLPGWIESVERDFNHPSLIGWCPFNETWDSAAGKQCDAVLAHVYAVTKALDATRPCIDTSGHFHVVTDIYDVHDYDQDPETFRARYAKMAEGALTEANDFKPRQEYDFRLPFFVSEYGGMKWDLEEAGNAWGYGQSVTTEEAFIARYRGLTDALLDHPDMIGFCYTQLYDIEQERNGLMTYAREKKFDPKIFYEINTRRAKIEENN